MPKFIDRLLNLIPVPSSPLLFSRPSLNSNTIAHAMGRWNDKDYLNCREAFETNYAKGARLFETDLFITSDKKIVLFHEGFEKRFGLNQGFSEEDFLAARPFGATLLNLAGLARLLKEYPDARIITDVKDKNQEILTELTRVFSENGIDYKHAVIPQFYHPSEHSGLKELGFKNFIFTVYRFRKMKNLTARLLCSHSDIIALTVPDKWVEAKNYLELGPKCGIDIFVHSISDEKRRKDLLSKGVRGVYTPNLFQSDLP